MATAVVGHAIVGQAIVGTPDNLGPQRDITVTGATQPRRWDATLTPARRAGTIQPRRWDGHTP